MGRRARVQRSAGKAQGGRTGTKGRRAFLYGAGAAALAGFAGWQFWPGGYGSAGSVTTDAIGDQIQRLPKSELPEFARTGDAARLYRYAVEHGDDLQYMPCFCGCFRFGHKSNRDCYIKESHQDGTLTFTSHAAT
jgi:hypothetical protein